ncbi:hypothetical protein Tco_0907135 [Tanacetum coccineum]|uniref:Integrase catalytic domain-containing protein n=1 Tax=Tanacetum coccineum TaxID=301880 RepID=A0ABQ5CJB2_9ASTR
MIQRNLQALVISIRTDRGTEFLNKTLNAFFKEEGIAHQTSTPRTPEQNDERKGDPCILVGYSTQSKGYRVYNKRTRLIVESIHLRFDEIKEMSETSVANDTSGLVPQRQKASDYDNPDPAPELQNVSPSADTTVPSQQELDLLLKSLIIQSRDHKFNPRFSIHASSGYDSTYGKSNQIFGAGCRDVCALSSFRFEKISELKTLPQSDLIESLLNRDTSIVSSPKFDSLLEEFSDNDSLMEEIDIFLAPYDSIPPSIKNDDYDSEGDILFLEELLSNDSLSLPKNESFHFDRYYDPSSPRPPAKPPDDDGIHFDIKPDTGTLTTKVVDDISEHYVLMPSILPTHPTRCPVIDTLLPFSSEIEDKVFNTGILASKEEKSPHLLSHRGFKAFQLISDFSERPMMIYGGNIPILDVPIAPDYEDSRAHGFVLRSLELQSLA